MWKYDSKRVGKQTLNFRTPPCWFLEYKCVLLLTHWNGFIPEFFPLGSGAERHGQRGVNIKLMLLKTSNPDASENSSDETRFQRKVRLERVRLNWRKKKKKEKKKSAFKMFHFVYNFFNTHSDTSLHQASAECTKNINWCRFMSNLTTRDSLQLQLISVPPASVQMRHISFHPDLVSTLVLFFFLHKSMKSTKLIQCPWRYCSGFVIALLGVVQLKFIRPRQVVCFFFFKVNTHSCAWCH